MRKSLIGNQSGMSLIGVMVAVGIIGIVTAGLVDLFSSSLKTQKSAEQKYSQIYLHNEIYQHLTNIKACTYTVGNKAFAYDAVTSPTAYTATTGANAITSIRTKGNLIAYQLYNGTTATLYENRNIKLTKISLINYKPDELPSGPTDTRFYSGTATMVLDYEKSSDSSGATKYKGREIKLKVTLKRLGEMISGVPVTAAEDKTLKECVAMGGSGDGSGDSLWTLNTSADGIYYNGKVGIGTTDPKTKLHVKDGSIIVDPFNSGASNVIDFSKSNIQQSTYNVVNGSVNLCGMYDGGTYTLVMRGQSIGNAFTFTAFEEPDCTVGIPFVDSGGVTMMNTSSTTIYNFMRIGSTVYATVGVGFTH